MSNRIGEQNRSVASWTSRGGIRGSKEKSPASQIHQPAVVVKAPSSSVKSRGDNVSDPMQAEAIPKMQSLTPTKNSKSTTGSIRQNTRKNLAIHENRPNIRTPSTRPVPNKMESSKNKPFTSPSFKTSAAKVVSDAPETNQKTHHQKTRSPRSCSKDPASNPRSK